MNLLSFMWQVGHSGSRLFLKHFFIKGAFCFFPFIPESEIKSIVELKLFVMERVMRSAYEPPPQKMPVEIFRIDFNIKVIDHTAKSHDRQLR